MTRLEEFLQEYKKTGRGEFHFDPDELQDHNDKQDHQERIVIPTIRRIGFDDEKLAELSKILKYPGEY